MIKQNLPGIIFGLRSFIYNMVYFFFPLYLLDLGFNGIQIGWLFGISIISALLFSYTNGIISDRFNLKHLAIYGVILMSMFFFGLSQFKGFIIFLVLFFIGGFGANIFEISIQSYFLKTINEKEKGKSFGIFWFIALLAASLGILFGGFILFLKSFSTALIIGAVLNLGIIIPIFYLNKNTLSNFTFIEYKKDILKKEAMLFAAIFFLFALHWGAEATSYAPFLNKVLGLNRWQIGVYMAIPIFIMSFFALGIGKRLDKSNSLRNYIFVGLLLSGFGHILMTFGTVYFSIAMRIIHEIGDAIIFVILFAGINKLFIKERIGGNTGFITTVAVFGKFIGSIVFSPLGFAYGYNYPLLISGMVTLLCMAFVPKR